MRALNVNVNGRLRTSAVGLVIPSWIMTVSLGIFRCMVLANVRAFEDISSRPF